MVWGCVLTSLIYTQLSNFPSTTCWEEGIFPILYSYLLCWRLIDHRCVDSFLVSLSCSIDLIFLYQYYTVLSTVTLQYCLKLDELYFLFYICSSELLWQFWVFYCSIQIFGLFALVLWKTIDNMDNLIRIALNLKIAFGFSSVTQSCPTLCNPMDCSIPGFPVHHQLQELTQTHVHQVGDAIQPTHPLSSPSHALNLSQHRIFSDESALHIRWPKYWSFSFSISPSSEHPVLISLRMDWLDLLVVQGTPTPQFKSINSLVLSFL